jgi:hypothetical protein
MPSMISNSFAKFYNKFTDGECVVKIPRSYKAVAAISSNNVNSYFTNMTKNNKHKDLMKCNKNKRRNGRDYKMVMME